MQEKIEDGVQWMQPWGRLLRPRVVLCPLGPCTRHGWSIFRVIRPPTIIIESTPQKALSIIQTLGDDRVGEIELCVCTCLSVYALIASRAKLMRSSLSSQVLPLFHGFPSFRYDLQLPTTVMHFDHACSPRSNVGAFSGTA